MKGAPCDPLTLFGLRSEELLSTRKGLTMAEATSSEEQIIAFDYFRENRRTLPPMTPEQLADVMEDISNRLRTKLPHLGLTELYVYLTNEGVNPSYVHALPLATRRKRVLYLGPKNAGWPRVLLTQAGSWLLIEYSLGLLVAYPFTRELMIERYSVEDLNWDIDPRRMLFGLEFFMDAEAEKADRHRTGLLLDGAWAGAKRKELTSAPK
jgi:hypothetical protein